MRSTEHRRDQLRHRADEMRHAPTAAEARLFAAIRGRRLGVTVRRQVPLAGTFIADFYVAEVRLVIEVDGGCHDDRVGLDARRDRALARLGYHVLHLGNDVVLGDLPAAIQRIRDAIAVARGRRE